MKPDPDNQLRKRIADALLAGDPCGHPDREIERALDAVRDSGEASELTDIEIGRILLKMRRKLPIGERVADAEAPAPFPAVEAKQKEQTPDRETVNNESKVPLAGNTIVTRPQSWWRTSSARAAMAAIWVVGLGIVLFRVMNPADIESVALGSDTPQDNTPEVAGDSGVPPTGDSNAKNLREENGSPIADSLLDIAEEVHDEQESKFVAISFNTDSLEKKRVPLSDGSVLFVNTNSKGSVDDLRRIQLEKGEIFLEVAPRAEEDDELLPGGATFTVDTPGGEVAALGTKFGVRATPSGTGVLVTQGTVRAEGLAKPLKAGQEMIPGPKHPVSPSPRASEALHWLRDLDTAANPPSAPPNAFLGGVLIAYDENGREKRIELKSSRIDVTMEEGFAVTTIDQTYTSNLLGPVEAVFYFPVPPDAAVTRFATGVEKKMVEADIVPREPARVAYKNAAAAGGRPGLMEWQDASTFSMRITPVKPGEEKRVRLSFTRRLNTDYGRTQYRLAGVGDAQFVDRWNAKFRIRGGARILWDSSSHDFTPTAEGPDLILSSKDRAGVAHRDLVVNFYDRGRQSPQATSAHKPRFSTFDGPGGRYLMVRHSPELGSGKVAKRRDWIFLYETSADRDVLEAKTASGIIRGILDHVGSGDTFSIVAVSTRPKVYAGGFQSVSPGNRAGISTFLNGLPKLGALNLELGFAEASRLAETVKNPVIVHLGSGIPVLGERNTVALLNLLPDAPFVGVGVGPRWNRPLMKYAAAKTGGFFTEVNPDEPARWRAFDLLSTLNAPRLIGVEVTAPNTGVKFHTFEDTLAHGEELCAIAKLPAHAPVPTQIAVHGFVDGDEWHQVVDVSSPKSAARYLADLWARLEIDSLLANGGGRDQVTAVSLTHHVLSPFTSFLTTPDVDRLLTERKKKQDKETDELEKAAGALAAEEAKSDLRPRSESGSDLATRTTSPPRAPLPAPDERIKSDMAEVAGVTEASPSPAKPVSPEPHPPTVSAGISPPQAPVPTESPVGDEPVPDARVDSPKTGNRVVGRSDSGSVHPGGERGGKDIESAESQPPIDPGASPSTVASKPDLELKDNAEKPRPLSGSMSLETENNDNKPKRVSEGLVASNPQPKESVDQLAEKQPAQKKREEGARDPFASMAGGGSARRPGDLAETDSEGDEKRIEIRGLLAGKKEKLQRQSLELRQLQLVQATDEEFLHLDKLELAYGNESDDSVEDISALEELRIDTAQQFSGLANKKLGRRQIAPFTANQLIYRQPRSELFLKLESNEEMLTTSELEDAGSREVLANRVDDLGDVSDGEHTSPRTTDPSRSRLTSTAKPGSGGLGPSAPPKSPGEPSGTPLLDSGSIGGGGAAGIARGSGIEPDSPSENARHQGEIEREWDSEKSFRREGPPSSSTPPGTIIEESGKVEDQSSSSPSSPRPGATTRPRSVGKTEFDHLNPSLSKAVPDKRKIQPQKEGETDSDSDRPSLRTPQLAPGGHSLGSKSGSNLRDHYFFWKRQAENTKSKDAPETIDTDPSSTHYGAVDFKDPLDWTLESTRGQVQSEDLLAVLLQVASARTEDPLSQKKLSRAFHELDLDAPELDYASRYESARALFKSGDTNGSLDAYTELYRSEIGDGMIPAFDDDLPSAFTQSGNVTAFYQLIRDAVEDMLADERFDAAVAIAWQCQATGHQDLADELLERIEVVVPSERVGSVASAALKVFGAESEAARVTEVLGLLIGDGADIDDSSLLRRAAKIAQLAGKRSHALEWLERALSLDYGIHQPTGRIARVNGNRTTFGFMGKQDARPPLTLDFVRKDFAYLFKLYHEQAAAMKTLGVSSSRNFTQQVIDSAENWRRLDPNPAAACKPAADVFTLLGKNDLAWEFATTPLALSPNDATAWQSLAEETGRNGLDAQAAEAERAAEAAAESSAP